MREKFLIFRFNGDKCAIQVNHIEEILRLQQMIKTNREEVNVIVGEKKAIPVLDLQRMISRRVMEHPITPKSRIIILYHEGQPYGILVDEIWTIMEIETKEIETPPAFKHRYITGVLENVYIFEPSAFLNSDLITIFQKIYKMNLEQVEKLETINGKEPEGKEKTLSNLQLAYTNFMIRAINNHLEPTFLKESAQIHKLINEL